MLYVCLRDNCTVNVPVITLYSTIRELEAQLDYERLKREKLEAQLDQYRLEIADLNSQMENMKIEVTLCVR